MNRLLILDSSNATDSTNNKFRYTYDREIETSGGSMTFVEYFLQNYLGEEMVDYEYDTEGKIIDYDLLPEYQKIVIAYNKWIDGDDLDPDEKEELGRNLFRSIVEAEKSFNLQEELLLFYEEGLRYELDKLDLQ